MNPNGGNVPLSTPATATATRPGVEAASNIPPLAATQTTAHVSSSSGSSTPTPRIPQPISNSSSTGSTSSASHSTSNSSSPRRPHTSLSLHNRFPSGSTASALATQPSTSAQGSLYTSYLPPSMRAGGRAQPSAPPRSSGATNGQSSSRASSSTNLSNEQPQLYVPHYSNQFQGQAGQSSSATNTGSRGVRPAHASPTGRGLGPSSFSSNPSQVNQMSANTGSGWQQDASSLHGPYPTQGTSSLGQSFGPQSSFSTPWNLNSQTYPLRNGSLGSANQTLMSNDPNGFSPSPFSTSPFEENTLLSFNWLISDLNLLRDEVELSPMPSEGGRSVSAGAGKSEIWTRQPVFGGGSWKVELVRTHRADEGVEEQAKDSINEENESQVEEHQSENTDGETSENDQVKDEKTAKGTTVLSVYLTSLLSSINSQVSTINAQNTSLTHIMIGLKADQPSTSTSSSNSTSDEWIYQRFTTFSFSKEHDFFEHHDLPTLSNLLTHETVQKRDSVVLVIQLASGNGMVGEMVNSAYSELSRQQLNDSTQSHHPNQTLPMIPFFDPKKISFPFHLPESKQVPSSMISSLNGLLDCKATADVRILVRERGIVRPSEVSTGSEVIAYEVQSFPIGSSLPTWFNPQVHGDEEGRPNEVYRHRILWAHSSVLKARSDYFKTMLDSEFIEAREEELEGREVNEHLPTWNTYESQEFESNQGYQYQPSQEQPQEGRGEVHQANTFRDNGTGRNRRVKTLRIGDADLVTVYWLLRYLYLNEISFEKLEDVKSSGMEFGLDEMEGKAHICWEWKTLEELEESGDASELNTNEAGGNEDQRQHPRDFGLDRRTSQRSLTSRTSLTGNGNGTSSTDSQNKPNSLSSPTSLNSPTPQEQSSIQPTSNVNQDPYSHPIAFESEAFSLAVYKLSHRYGQTDLAELAKKHLLKNLNPRNAFPTLLATGLYKDVQLGVRGWVCELFLDSTGNWM